jgi:hypothetical protein
MGNEVGRAPFMIERDQREIHIFLEKELKSGDQLEDNCVVWGMIKKLS